jgi:hypothetical protein
MRAIGIPVIVVSFLARCLHRLGLPAQPEPDRPDARNASGHTVMRARDCAGRGRTSVAAVECQRVDCLLRSAAFEYEVLA